ncbi:MAG: metal-dependent hydrolase [Bryobacteraceae bacterium]|jgi:inner membrane protein
MPTILTHAVAGIAIAQALAPCSRRAEISLFAAGCAMLPDVDVLGFYFGVPYDSLFGHRGITHSLLFAGLVAVTITLCLRNKALGGDLRVLLCLFVATASHGVLDAFTNGGLGVAFFAPFHSARYFFPVRPIMVSPLNLGAFLTHRGVSVLLSETNWVWAPSVLVLLVARSVRCR